jgi:hypothetical protein
MDVLELLNHYRLEKLNDKENELFTYFAYSYAIENDENNHPSFRISLFSKISRIAVLDFVISYKGQISYACQICRDKQPCYHFSILVTKLLNDEYEQIKALSERFNYEVGDVDRREQQAAFDYELKQVFEEIRKEDIANASTKARLKIYLEDTRFSYSVNLTIAKGKEYRIASIDRFLNRFINEEEFRYGKDLTIILCLFPDISSISVSALTTILPLPVVYASFIPSLPRIKPSVGKSGPLTVFISSSSDISGLSIIALTPSITSPRLCGGIFVAIPTAIPEEPLTNSAGILAGNTVGSCNLPSKLGVKSTVFFSISVNINSDIFDILASV